MPLYEYICREDGDTIELLRPMRAADDPVEDPKGLGRTFIRQFSTFEVGTDSRSASPPSFSGGCPCGNPDGPCHG